MMMMMMLPLRPRPSSIIELKGWSSRTYWRSGESAAAGREAGGMSSAKEQPWELWIWEGNKREGSRNPQRRARSTVTVSKGEADECPAGSSDHPLLNCNNKNNNNNFFQECYFIFFKKLTFRLRISIKKNAQHGGYGKRKRDKIIRIWILLMNKIYN